MDRKIAVDYSAPGNTLIYHFCHSSRLIPSHSKSSDGIIFTPWNDINYRLCHPDRHGHVQSLTYYQVAGGNYELFLQ